MTIRGKGFQANLCALETISKVCVGWTIHETGRLWALHQVDTRLVFDRSWVCERSIWRVVIDGYFQYIYHVQLKHCLYH